MIKLIVADYCHNCPEFEPDVERKSDTYYSDDIFSGVRKYMTVCETVVSCAHRYRCESITHHLKRETKKESN